ncbi:MAG: helix-turn-helix domain-containing protein [Defluviitaleaceae bacterium]|nr:helix-turn-helix domain-containing protein [Defluviitaleaceae bacterium]
MDTGKMGIMIERLRSERSISWTELSERTGISRCYIHKLRKGIDERSGRPINPSIKTLQDIADALEVSRREFLQLCGYIEE